MSKLLYEELTYSIRGCAFRVYNSLGYGHKERVYQKALALEFKDSNILFEQEKPVQVFYKEISVGIYRPDFLVEEKIIIETKSVPLLSKDYVNQVMNYVKATGYSIALVMNFGATTIDIRRLIWTPSKKSQ